MLSLSALKNFTSNEGTFLTTNSYKMKAFKLSSLSVILAMLFIVFIYRSCNRNDTYQIEYRVVEEDEGGNPNKDTITILFQFSLELDVDRTKEDLNDYSMRFFNKENVEIIYNFSDVTHLENAPYKSFMYIPIEDENDYGRCVLRGDVKIYRNEDIIGKKHVSFLQF